MTPNAPVVVRKRVSHAEIRYFVFRCTPHVSAEDDPPNSKTEKNKDNTLALGSFFFTIRLRVLTHRDTSSVTW